MPSARPDEPRLITTLFLGSGAAALAGALANVVTLAVSVDVAAVRDLELFFAILGPPGVPRAELLGRLFAVTLPALLRRPFELRAAGPLLTFTALSIVATLLACWVLAALAAPVVLVTARIFRSGSSNQWLRWVWMKAYPLGVLVGFGLPAVLGVAHHLLMGTGETTVLGASIVVAVLAWFGLLKVLGSPERIGRFVRACFVCGLVVAVFVWSGAAIAAALNHQRARPAAAPGLPNVLLVSIDSLRGDHVHCYGYSRATSPTIDALAQDGALFRTVVSPTSWTLPAHLTLLTSLPPEEHGVVADGMRLREEALFLAEVFWNAGYATAGFVSAPYLDSVYGFGQGFDHYDDYSVANISHEASQHSVTSAALLRVVSEWLGQWDGNGRQRPFFMFVHMWDVHYDYTPPPPYDSMFDPDYTGNVTGENYELGTQVHMGMDPRDLQHVIALYDGEIRFTDLYLGKVLERLRELGVFDDTVVVVTADHGDEFFEHGRKGHKKALYDESILVPLVIRYPKKVPAGRTVQPQVRLMDIAPTTIALAGLSKPREFGTTVAKGANAPQDLSSWITAASPAALPALTAFSDLVGEAPVPIAAVRTEAFKFIKELQSRRQEELYDLVADPGEHANLIGPDHAVDVPLRRQLADWRQAWQGGRKLSEKVDLSEEHKERLRALGYMK